MRINERLLVYAILKMGLYNVLELVRHKIPFAENLQFVMRLWTHSKHTTITRDGKTTTITFESE